MSHSQQNKQNRQTHGGAEGYSFRPSFGGFGDHGHLLGGKKKQNS